MKKEKVKKEKSEMSLYIHLSGRKSPYILTLIYNTYVTGVRNAFLFHDMRVEEKVNEHQQERSEASAVALHKRWEGVSFHDIHRSNTQACWH